MAKKKNEALIELKKQLKEKRLSPLYLFYGEEELLRETYVKRVTDAVGDNGFPEFNRIKLEGRDVPLSDYDDAWEGFPMMSDKRVIHIKNSDIFTSKRAAPGEASSEDKKKFWTEKLKRLSDDTVVVFDETGVDKRSALYKAAAKAGFVVEFAYLREEDAVTWIIKQCLDAKRKITKDNAFYLLSLCDPGLNNVKNELGKLFDFCGTDISRSDIDRIVSKSLQVVVFELTNAIMECDARKAIAAMEDLKNSKESPFQMLYLLLASFEKLLRVKLMHGRPRNEILSALGAGPYIGGKYIDSANGFSERALIWMVRRVAEIDLEIKEGKTDEWTALEQYVMECVYHSGR